MPVLMTSRSSPVSLHHQQSLTILHHPGSCRIIFKPSRGRSISLRSISLRSILGSILHRTGHHVAIAWRAERHLADLFSNSSLPRLHSILRVFLNSFINFLFFFSKDNYLVEISIPIPFGTFSSGKRFPSSAYISAVCVCVSTVEN